MTYLVVININFKKIGNIINNDKIHFAIFFEKIDTTFFPRIQAFIMLF